MGFTKSYANTVLSNTFAVGNTIGLLKSVNTETGTYSELSGTGYARYTIKNGDFTASGGVIQTNSNLLYGLAESAWGTAVGLAVFKGSEVLYLAELTSPVAIAIDTVPVFKKFDADKGTGIRVTLDVVSAASASA